MEAVGMIVGIVIVVIVSLAGAFFFLGWIAPLVIGLVRRRRSHAGARGWLIAASAWGALALLVAVGLGVLSLFAFRSYRSDLGGLASECNDFDPAAFKGPTATLRSAHAGEAHVVACGEGSEQTRYGATNGLITVPAGEMRISRCDFVERGADGRTWTATASLSEEATLSAAAGSVQDLGFGPPLVASAQVTWTPASDRISLAPVFVDSAGNEYTVSSEPRAEKPAEFQFVDSQDRVVWRGNFEYG